uniref:Uncharacterized protein n=1 Tax=Monopterus albus TaxID=43700 RepID=A0A3Q3J7G7_MONAL
TAQILYRVMFSPLSSSPPCTAELPPDGKRNVHVGVFVTRKDITFVAEVDSSNLTKTANKKWLKGKWLDLGCKAGKHLQFKESYDRNTKMCMFIPYMSISKVVDGDAGGCRCGVTSKDECDSCTVQVSVQAVQEEQQDNILEAFKLSGDAGEDAGDLDFSMLLKKRYGHLHFQSCIIHIQLSKILDIIREKKQQKPKEEVDAWEILKAAQTL